MTTRFRTPEWPARVRSARARLGLSVPRFAQVLGVAPAVLRNWESGRSDPDGPARALLVVAASEPAAVARALRVAR